MSRDRIKLLIVAAYSKELAPLCRLGTKHFLIKKDIAFLAAGIGPVAAAFGLTHFLEDYRPERIIGIGTAGIINPKLKIGDVVIGKSISIDPRNHEVSVAGKPCCIATSSQHRHVDTSTRRHVSIFAPQDISNTETRRLQLVQAGHDVENLEAYAFAFVAKKFRIPFVSLLGLTNHVGPQGHAEWAKNERQVCERLASILNKS